MDGTKDPCPACGAATMPPWTEGGKETARRCPKCEHVEERDARP